MADLSEKRIKLILDLASSSKDADDFRAKLDALGLSVKRTGGASREAYTQIRDAGFAVRELGRIAQDASQGGLAGVLNNVEGLAQHLGGASGALTTSGAAALGGAITLLATAAWMAAPHLKEVYKTLTTAHDGGVDWPAATTNIEKYSEALGKVGARLEELKKKGKLTTDELLEVDAKSLEEELLRDKLGKAKDDDAALAALRKAEADAKLDKDVGKRVAAGIAGAGGVDAVVVALANQLVDPVKAAADKASAERIAKLTADRDALAKETAADREAARATPGGVGLGESLRMMANQNKLKDLEAELTAAQMARGKSAVDQAADEAKALVAAAARGDRDAATKLFAMDRSGKLPNFTGESDAQDYRDLLNAEENQRGTAQAATSALLEKKAKTEEAEAKRAEAEAKRAEAEAKREAAEAPKRADEARTAHNLAALRDEYKARSGLDAPEPILRAAVEDAKRNIDNQMNPVYAMELAVNAVAEAVNAVQVKSFEAATGLNAAQTSLRIQTEKLRAMQLVVPTGMSRGAR